MNVRLLTATCLVALLSCQPLIAAPGSSPTLIAHRGGTADAPENTLVAIEKALQNGAQAVWITIQLSQDGIPVLYRPSDLKSQTDRQGLVSAFTAAQLAEMDAGWAYAAKDGGSPYRGKGIGVPTLEQALARFPGIFFHLDLKSPDADPKVMGQALERALKSASSLERVRVYSTDQRYLEALPPTIPRFASRDETRGALAEIAMAHRCVLPAASEERWHALELERKVEVVEKFTLGEGRSAATLAWDKEAMECFRSRGPARIVLLGVNGAEAYKKAKELGADGVVVDSPALFKTIER